MTLPLLKKLRTTRSQRPTIKSDRSQLTLTGQFLNKCQLATCLSLTLLIVNTSFAQQFQTPRIPVPDNSAAQTTPAWYQPPVSLHGQQHADAIRRQMIRAAREQGAPDHFAQQAYMAQQAYAAQQAYTNKMVHANQVAYRQPIPQPVQTTQPRMLQTSQTPARPVQRYQPPVHIAPIPVAQTYTVAQPDRRGGKFNNDNVNGGSRTDIPVRLSDATRTRMSVPRVYSQPHSAPVRPSPPIVKRAKAHAVVANLTDQWLTAPPKSSSPEQDLVSQEPVEVDHEPTKIASKIAAKTPFQDRVVSVLARTERLTDKKQDFVSEKAKPKTTVSAVEIDETDFSVQQTAMQEPIEDPFGDLEQQAPRLRETPARLQRSVQEERPAASPVSILSQQDEDEPQAPDFSQSNDDFMPSNDLRTDSDRQLQLQPFAEDDDEDEDSDTNPMNQDCDSYRERLLNNPIRNIGLNISPPASERRSQFRTVSRSWTDRAGRIVATGTMIDLRRGYVVIESDQGQQKLSFAKLSDADLAAVSEYWQIPTICSVGNDGYVSRCWAPQTYTWTASSLCHKPLYFENIQLERYGHSHGPFTQPVRSAAHFFVSLVTVPYQSAIHPANECQYSLGFYRPGNCAPWLKDPIPISLSGARRQALATAGLALIP